MDYSTMIMAACALLKIETPVRVLLKTKVKRNEKNLAGYCSYKTRKGFITEFNLHIMLPECIMADYSTADVILHEICHAAQIEHGIFDWNNHHDSKFQALCNILESELPKMGFKVGSLYNPKLDTD